MRPTSVTLALLAATLSATASAQDLAADTRPPPFWPLQRADTLILRAGPDAGSPSSLAALDRFPCRGNACRPQVVEEGAIPAAPTARPVDQAYVGHASPLGSAAEGGAYDAAGSLTPAGAASIRSLALARATAGSGSLFASLGADGVAALGGQPGATTSYVPGTKEIAAAADPVAAAQHDAAVAAAAESAAAAQAAVAEAAAAAATRPLVAAAVPEEQEQEAAPRPIRQAPDASAERQQTLAEEAGAAAAATSPAPAPKAEVDAATTTATTTTLPASSTVAPLPPLSSVLDAAVTRFADTTQPLPSASEASGALAAAASHLAAAAGTGAPGEGAAPRDDAELLSAVVRAAAAGMAARLTGQPMP